MGLIHIAVFLGYVADGTAADAGTVPLMRDPKLPAILSVTIKENGATSPAADPSTESCKSFILSKHDIREYFQKAQEVSQHDYYHMLDWSPCYASGTIEFKGGMTGVWGIQQYRAGSLRLSNGKERFLYCPTCRAQALQPEASR